MAPATITPALDLGSEFGAPDFRECETDREARDLAHDDAVATGGSVFPATWFVQGGRNHLAFAMRLSEVVRFAQRNSAVKGEDPRQALNRPLKPEHAKGIEDYLVKNAGGHYILPALTLTTGTEVNVYAIRSKSKIRSAYLVLPNDARLFVTDGQHRLVALGGDPSVRKLSGALVRAPELASDAVSIDLVLEDDPERIHQDFADAAQTLAMPPSMLAAYNQREPFNRVLNQLSTRAQLLAGRIDMSSTTLSKNSQRLFLLNQVRGFLKELVIGDYAASEERVSRASEELLETRELQDEWIGRAVRVIDYLSDRMTPWTQIKSMRAGGPESAKVAKLREEYLNCTATGLNLIGRVANRLIVNYPDDEAAQNAYLNRLAKLDWRKDSPMWAGNVIVDGHKVATARAQVNGAAARIFDAIGWQVP